MKLTKKWMALLLTALLLAGLLLPVSALADEGETAADGLKSAESGSFVPVTSIDGVPEALSYELDALELPGTALPADATNNQIVWKVTGYSFYSPELSPASVSIKDGNRLSLEGTYNRTGRISLLATVRDGAEAGSDYTASYTIKVGDYPVAYQTDTVHKVVTNVQAPALISQYRKERADPAKISYLWQCYNAETGQWDPARNNNTGDGYRLPSESYGTDQYGKATIKIQNYRFRCKTLYDGLLLPYETFRYSINFISATDIVGYPSSVQVGWNTPMKAHTGPDNASVSEVLYEITDPGLTNAFMKDGTLMCNAAGTIKLRMTAPRAVEQNGRYVDFVKDVTITAYQGPPKIVEQPPEKYFVQEGEHPYLTVGVEDTSDYLSYQWMQSKEDGVSWENVEWDRHESSLPMLSRREDDGTLYKCIVTNEYGSSETAPCTLRVYKKATQQPVGSVPSSMRIDVSHFILDCSYDLNGAVLTPYQSAIEPGPIQVEWRTWREDELTITRDEECMGYRITPVKVQGSYTYLFLYLTQELDGKKYETCFATYRIGIIRSPPTAPSIWDANLAPVDSVTVSQYSTVRLHAHMSNEWAGRYQWQMQAPDKSKEEDWVNIEGATNADYDIYAAEADMNGTKFRCLSDNGYTTPSNPVTLKVTPAPVPPVEITEAPQSMETTEGNDVAFGVRANGDELSYQWQESSDGENWSSLEGEADSWLILSAVTKEQDGRRYRCVVTGKGEEDSTVTQESLAALLRVQSYPKVTGITPDFEEFYLHVQNDVSGTAQLDSGTGEPEILWFVQDDGNTGAELTLENKLTARSEGTVMLLAIVENGLGAGIPYRQEFQVPIVVDEERTPPVVYPSDNTLRVVPQGAQPFLAAAAEGQVDYQWESSSDRSEWHEIQGETNYYYQTPAVSLNTVAYYRCKVFNDYGAAYTEVTTVIGVAAIPVESVQCSLTRLEAGESAWLSDYATVTPGTASYQDIEWSVTDPGRTGARLDAFGRFTADAEGTAIVTATIVNGGLPDAESPNYTQDFTISISEFSPEPPVILAQPEDLTVPAGSPAIFAVWASGAGVEYQWQRRKSETEEWQNLKDGVGTPLYKISQASAGDNGSQFRCLLSNSALDPVFSTAATLTVTSNGASGGSPGGGGGGEEPSEPEPPDDEPKDLPFTDVSKTDWFYDSVSYVYEKGLFHGTSETSFSPDGRMTRGMAVTVLYRMAGSPAPEGGLDSPFADVDPSAYYAAAVYWARSSGVMMGTGGGRFTPDGSLTREQLAATLYRFAGSPEVTKTLNRFTDGASASKYAEQALCWAVEQGILTGKGGGILDPKGTAKRCEIAAMVTRYCLLEV